MNPVEEFLKEAGIWDAIKSGLTFENAGGLAKRLGKSEAELSGSERVFHQLGGMASKGGLTAGLVGAATMGLKGGEGLYDAMTSSGQHRKEFEAMMAAHPSLKEEDPAHVDLAFRSVKHLSPALATDPLAAGSVVRNLLAYGRTEQGLTMPPETAKMLTETHRNIMQSSGKGGPNPMLDAFSKGISGPMGKSEKAPVINVHSNAFDPDVTSTQHEFFDPEGNLIGSEHRKYEK